MVSRRAPARSACVEQRVDVLLVDAVLGIVDENMIRMARTAHEIARNTGIGLRDPDPQLLFGFGHGFADGAAHQFDILDLARVDPSTGFDTIDATSIRPSATFSPTATTTFDEPRSTATV